jgi:hypothetical protein
VRPSPPLYSTVQYGQCQLRGTVPPTSVRPACRTLERGRRNPQKGYECLSRARTGRRRDVGPVRRVSSVTIGPMRPSPPLHHHPKHCSTIPDAVGTQDDKTSPRPPLCDLQPFVSSTLELTHARRPNKKLPGRYPRSRPWKVQDSQRRSGRSKIHQDGHPLYGTVHHTATRS